MTTLREFTMDDLLKFNNVNLDVLTETYNMPFVSFLCSVSYFSFSLSLLTLVLLALFASKVLELHVKMARVLYGGRSPQRGFDGLYPWEG
jgi:hypothetical protein